MNYRIMHIENIPYIEVLPESNLIAGEQDALSWIALCGEEKTSKLLIHAENLTPDFFDLSTGIAGEILLKFVNYYIRVAAILTPELVNRGKFREMVLETNRGSDFRVFSDRKQAENWFQQLANPWESEQQDET
jgi:PadR family transcriptional regulator, regulatory protein AphA